MHRAPDAASRATGKSSQETNVQQIAPETQGATVIDFLSGTMAGAERASATIASLDSILVSDAAIQLVDEINGTSWNVPKASLAFKRSFGPLSYLISAAQIAARKPPLLHIESANAVSKEGSFVLVGNGRLYGGPFPFFKNAVIDDGLLDVVIFKQLGYLEIIKYLQNVIFTSDITTREVEYFQTRRLRVSSAEDVPVELDGELVGACPVEFQMQSRRLRVLAPV